ncbi:MAG: hypothetical protein P8Z39_04390 [Gammaproteobacteria bacterium]|jgi:hypothetical protein
MITKFDMASGKPTYQSEHTARVEIASKPFELIEQTTSLQLIAVADLPQAKTMPPDLASISVDEFLRDQG